MSQPESGQPGLTEADYEGLEERFNSMGAESAYELELDAYGHILNNDESKSSKAQSQPSKLATLIPLDDYVKEFIKKHPQRPCLPSPEEIEQSIQVDERILCILKSLQESIQDNDFRAMNLSHKRPFYIVMMRGLLSRFSLLEVKAAAKIAGYNKEGVRIWNVVVITEEEHGYGVVARGFKLFHFDE